MNEARRQSPTGWLARLGFTDAARTEGRLAGFDLDDALLEAAATAADPDLALDGLLRLLEHASSDTYAAADIQTVREHTSGAGTRAGPEVREHTGGQDAGTTGAEVREHAGGAGTRAGAEVRGHAGVGLGADAETWDRLLAVLGVSSAFADHLVRHPEHWRVLSDVRKPDAGELRTRLLVAVGADPEAREPVAASGDPVPLRVAYFRALLHLAGRDLTHVMDVEEVAAELADLAAAALEAGLAIGRAELGEQAASCRLAVIGMGKCGGRELNYVSDVDVIFVAEAADGHDEDTALRTATKLAKAMMRACSQSTPEGSLWEVDPALRPEGKAGPLVRTLASHRAYYERWAKTWEFQALLKARPVAGDLDLGRAYVETLAPMVWRAAEREHFVEDVQAMRRRVEEHISPDEAERQLKLGPGGLRDVEFAVQLLQLVHGRGDEELRGSNTLNALKKLSWGGYVGRADAAALGTAYRFLRRVEHLIQLHRLRRTHLVPTGEADLRRLGRALGFRTDPVKEFTAEWRRHAREVRRLHEKLFYRPLLQAVARLPEEEATLTRDAARARLEALGYTDPDGALRHLEALTSGVSRRAAIQRTLLPVMLGWFADAPDPDAGLLGFRQVSDALGTTPWYLRLLRDDVTVAERMARLLASSRYATDLLLRAPEAVTLLGGGEVMPRNHDALRTEALAAVGRHDVPDDAATAIRALRRRELLRISVADLLGRADVDLVGTALTDVAAVTIEAALKAAVKKIEIERRAPLPTRFAIVAMGRFGGRELGYGSDADVMFVHDPIDDERTATTAAHDVAEELRRLLALPAPDPPLVIDPGLRPEGRQGPLVRTLDSYASYYRRWSSPWESQALLRALPLVGDAELCTRFNEVIDPVRWPEGGVDEAAVREIRRLKARMEAERLPRGIDRTLHTKLGPGGLSDVEWVAQLLQLRHAYELPELRTTRTVGTLEAATEAGLLSRDDAATLIDAWRLATRIRNAVMLVRGRPFDTLPTEHRRERSAVAAILGYPTASDLLEDYQRHARHARHAFDRLFYGVQP